MDRLQAPSGLRGDPANGHDDVIFTCRPGKEGQTGANPLQTSNNYQKQQAFWWNRGENDEKYQLFWSFSFL